MRLACGPNFTSADPLGAESYWPENRADGLDPLPLGGRVQTCLGGRTTATYLPIMHIPEVAALSWLEEAEADRSSESAGPSEEPSPGS